MAFMFETRYPQQVTKYAAELPSLQKDYPECWSGMPRMFNGKP
jgi:homogentisate 1,2-dioxygenase